MEADSLGSRHRIDGLRQAGLVTASSVFLDHALLNGFVDQAECSWKNRFGVRRLSGINCRLQLLHLCFQLMPVGLIESLQFQTLTVPF